MNHTTHCGYKYKIIMAQLSRQKLIIFIIYETIIILPVRQVNLMSDLVHPRTSFFKKQASLFLTFKFAIRYYKVQGGGFDVYEYHDDRTFLTSLKHRKYQPREIKENDIFLAFEKAYCNTWYHPP